jgi:hypothetical protein
MAELFTPRSPEVVDRTTADVELTSTSQTAILTFTPVVDAAFTIKIMAVVKTATTDLTVTVTFTDSATGSSQTADSAAFTGSGTAVGVAWDTIHMPAQGGQPVTVNATAGTANQAYLRATATADY